MNGIEIEITENTNESNKELSKIPDSNASLHLKNNIITSDNTYIESFNTDNFVAKQLDYQENYLLVDLKKIAEYYDIATRKLKKDELVQEIVLFESDPNNSETYLRRLQAWYWLKELKEDTKLKQYILF